MQVVFLRNVVPGDMVEENGFKDYGIYKNRCTVAGQFCKIEDLYFVRTITKFYVPRKYDVVIGRIIYTNPDFYKVDLNGCIGVLPVLSFLNATKRNKPEFEKNEFVVAQVLKVEGSEPLLCCRRDGLGKIDEAHKIEGWKIRLFYFNDFLKKLSETENFKIILAINGYVWIGAEPETKLRILNRINDYN